MNNKSFNDARIAEGYAKDRPYLHPQVIEIVQKDLGLDKKILKGLDIGCGAGLSSKALKTICEYVTGTDISPEMVRIAKAMCNEEKFSFYVCKAEEIASDTVYDIATAAGVVNWVDQKAFLKNTNHILNRNCYLIIYDFWITDIMKGRTDYTQWWNEQYLPKFPKPFRNENRWSNQEVRQFGFQMEEQKEIELTWKFDMESFVRFMLIQSNVNEQIEKGIISEDDAKNWFRETLGTVFSDEIKTLVFYGYIWYVKKVA